MKIIIDGRMINTTGIGRYTKALLTHLQNIDTTNAYTVLLQAKDFDTWQPSSTNFSKKLVDINFYSLREQLFLPFVLWRLRPDLVHFPFFNAPVLYLGKRVITIHDLTLLHFKNIRGTSSFKKALYELKYWGMRLILWSAAKSPAIITDCQTVKDELTKHYHVIPERITTTPLAVDPLLAKPVEMESLAKTDFLLYVGNFYPHKNVGLLIRAFAKLSSINPSLQLVIVGKSDYFQELLMRQAVELSVDKQVLFTGFVTDSELVWLYKNAKLFVFPSLSEGFGLTPLEAMAGGTPVLSSKASCLPEVCGKAASYFDPHNASELANLITAALADKQQLRKLVELGHKQVAKYSWERMAKQTLKVYSTLQVDAEPEMR